MQLGATMNRILNCLVFLAILVLGLSPVVLAEDLPDTAYDESETQPYERGVDLTSQTTSEAQAAITQAHAVPSALRPPTPIPFQRNAKPVSDPYAHRFTGARGLLAQVCTLLF
jgi:hypothetical protein